VAGTHMPAMAGAALKIVAMTITAAVSAILRIE
jgi:hypothetical protein